MLQKLKLPVTLIAADSGCEALTRASLKDCLDRVEFDELVVLGDRAEDIIAGLHAPCTHMISTQPIRSVGNWSFNIWYMAPTYVHNTHALITQWDAGVINPKAWTPEWIEYDYIGALWYWHPEGSNVGNGGFSLRSMKLMKYLAENVKTMPLVLPEDDAICRRYRPRLEAEGFRFAPPAVAQRFSWERTLGQDLTDWPFGFHGMFNWPLFMTRERILERMKLAPARIWNHPHCREMMENRLMALG